MKIINYLLVGILMAILTGCAAMETETAATPDQPDRQDVLYTCNCGEQCKCNTVSTEPGNCACGAPLKWGHVLKVEGNEAILCQCNEGCGCSGFDPKDPSKCSCGKPVKRVNMTNTGVYFCNCGGSCFCNTVSGEPGKCKCGMNLKKVE